MWLSVQRVILPLVIYKPMPSKTSHKGKETMLFIVSCAVVFCMVLVSFFSFRFLILNMQNALSVSDNQEGSALQFNIDEFKALGL